MKWIIEFSKSSDKFIQKNHIDRQKIISLIIRVIKRLSGENINIDIKKMKGEWEGFFRIRLGKIRLLTKFDFNELKAYLDKIDYRGDVYK